jgi:hypothetical protein
MPANGFETLTVCDDMLFVFVDVVIENGRGCKWQGGLVGYSAERVQDRVNLSVEKF